MHLKRLMGLHRPLQQADVVIADCGCGELVTSLEMAGVSLSLFCLDGELEPFWLAPADSAAYWHCAVAAGTFPVEASEQQGDVSAPSPLPGFEPGALTPAHAAMQRGCALSEVLMEVGSSAHR